MYQFKNALTLGKTIGAQWEYRDLSDVFIYSAYQEFKKIYLILTHVSVDHDLYVDMEDVRQDAYSFNGSITQWIGGLEGKSVPFTDSLPDSNIRYVPYANAIQSGYDVQLANAGLHYPDGVNARNFGDLKLTRTQFKTDMELINNYCLMTVNGYFHNHVGNQSEVVIEQGGKSGFKAQDTQVGILSFLDVGKLNKIKIDPLKIFPSDEGGTLYERLRFDIDIAPITKPFFLILGGYLVFPKNNVFFQSGNNSYTLSVKDLHYEERIMESEKFLDLSSMGFIRPNIAPSGYDLENLRSDAVIKKYLTMSQSFFVTVDAPMLAINKHVIQRAAFPGQFLHHEDPVFPIQGANGRFLDYWKIQEGEMWSLNCTDTFSRNFVYPEGTRDRAKYALGALDTTRRYDHTQAYMLELSTYKE